MTTNRQTNHNQLNFKRLEAALLLLQILNSRSYDQATRDDDVAYQVWVGVRIGAVQQAQA